MSKNRVLLEGSFTADTRKIINDNFLDGARSRTQLDRASSTVFTDVAGLITDTLEIGTYKFKVILFGTATSNGGIKAALKFGTASMLTSIEVTTRGYTASAVATQRSTTATDAASLFASTTAVILTIMEGVLVVAIPGTLQVQIGQNASHGDTTSVYVNSFLEFRKVA